MLPAILSVAQLPGCLLTHCSKKFRDRSEARLIARIAKRNVPIQKFVGQWCSKVRAKCQSWALNLRDRGCGLLVIIHDLDEASDTATLMSELVRNLDPSPIKRHVIVILVREIEAWLSADDEAIRKAMKLSQPMKRVSNPERLMHPKEHLRDQIFIRSRHKSHYVNTIHNKKIAWVCKLANLRQCPSFLNAHLP